MAERLARRHKRAQERLGPIDWIEAGQDLLCEIGTAGLKLSALTERLGVSTGSFYHHFTDMDSYLTALANHFSTAEMQSLLAKASEGNADGLTRIRRLARISIDNRLFELARAMRAWAVSDRRAADAIAESEVLTLNFLTDAFADIGFDRADASLRAHLLLSANIALIGDFSLGGGREAFERALELLCQGAVPRPRS